MNNVINNNKKTCKKRRLLSVMVSYLLLTPFTTSFSQDLSISTDLQESPLSLSLTPSTTMTINEQQQQVMVSQYGILNTANIKQLANASNQTIIIQDGIGNNAFVEQLGTGNTVNIEQRGHNNLAGVTQDGNDNIANITQAGEQTFIVHQIGNEMVVNISQY